MATVIFCLCKTAKGTSADNLKKVYSGIPAIVERCSHPLWKPRGHRASVAGFSNAQLCPSWLAAVLAGTPSTCWSWTWHRLRSQPVSRSFWLSHCTCCRWVEFRNQVLQQPNGQAVLVSGRPDNYDIAWISDQIEQLISVRLLAAPATCWLELSLGADLQDLPLHSCPRWRQLPWTQRHAHSLTVCAGVASCQP